MRIELFRYGREGDRHQVIQQDRPRGVIRRRWQVFREADIDAGDIGRFGWIRPQRGFALQVFVCP
jgi:hypothetical protein